MIRSRRKMVALAGHRRRLSRRRARHGGDPRQPQGLHLRAVLRVHTDSDDGALYVEGFSPDGSMLVAQILRDRRDAIVVWDVATGKLRKVIGPERSDSKDENEEASEGKTSRVLGET